MQQECLAHGALRKRAGIWLPPLDVESCGACVVAECSDPNKMAIIILQENAVASGFSCVFWYCKSFIKVVRGEELQTLLTRIPQGVLTDQPERPGEKLAAFKKIVRSAKNFQFARVAISMLSNQRDDAPLKLQQFFEEASDKNVWNSLPKKLRELVNSLRQAD